MWVDRGEVVLIADSQGVRDIYSADGNALDATTPLSVLVNKGTGSAAEVCARLLARGGAFPASPPAPAAAAARPPPLATLPWSHAAAPRTRA